MMPYVSPSYNVKLFNCPHCIGHAQQHWGIFFYFPQGRQTRSTLYSTATCNQCGEVSIWKGAEMIYPMVSTVPPPNEDLSPNIKDDYNEARDITLRSPRSACGLLRLCIENLVNEVETGSGDLNEKIGELVEKGLDKKIQQALDSVRVIGGEALHPLQMDLKDDKQTAESLFDLVNIIADWTITRTKKIDAIYDKLPDGKREAIEKRDKKI